ncbi:MAG: DUF342 domain-containing protein [Firmicutes bacterium]|nr:DUF342 domain-containing protein [Candidatus Fermentithermobacillaceae bacterium]
MSQERRVVFVPGFAGASLGKPPDTYKVGPGFKDAWSGLLARGFCSPGSVLGFLRETDEPHRPALAGIGENVEMSEDRSKILARTAGVPYVENGIPGVLRRVVIDGDVGVETGEINFPGDVVITGNISRGYRVSAWGTVKVEGTCAGAVSCTEDLVVKGGINCPGTPIEAGRDVIAKFIENSVVWSRRNVIVSQAILHSRVEAEGEIIITQPGGRLVGGLSRAGVGVIVPVLGAPIGAKTVVELGVSPRERRIYDSAERDLKAVEKEIDEVTRMMSPKAKGGSVDTLRLKRYLARLDEKRKGLLQRIAAMKEEFKAGKGFLSADLVLPGAVVVMGTEPIEFHEETRFVRMGVAPSETH